VLCRTTPEWLASTMDIPILDVSAAFSDDGYLNLAVVNVSDSKSQEASLPAIEGTVQVSCVGGNENDVRIPTRGVHRRWESRSRYGMAKGNFFSKGTILPCSDGRPPLLGRKEKCLVSMLRSPQLPCLMP
jgi:hypothetical protein